MVGSAAEAARAERGAGAPTRVGRYELLHEVASGGMATVYLGRASGAAGFERLFAIKLCHPHLRREGDFAAMFLDEARLAARIHHPNVVGTVDVGKGDELYIVMEWIEGSSLSQLIKAALRTPDKHIPRDVAVRIAYDALQGLHAAHEVRGDDGAMLDLIHRDMSPQNVLVGVDGVSRITDFGVAKAQTRLVQTSDAVVKGKQGYFAPEQLRGKPVDRRVDVFAAGVVLWESVAGARLFRGESPEHSMHLTLKCEIPSLRERRPDVPEQLDWVLSRALAKEPTARYDTALEFAEALESTGIPMAKHRRVADWVRETLADELESRSDLLAALRRGEGGAVRLPTDEAGASEVRPRSGWTRRIRRASLPILLGAFLGAVAFGWWLATPTDRPPVRVKPTSADKVWVIRVDPDAIEEPAVPTMEPVRDVEAAEPEAEAEPETDVEPVVDPARPVREPRPGRGRRGMRAGMEFRPTSI